VKGRQRMRVIHDEHGVTYVAPGVLAPQERAALAGRPAAEGARARLQAALKAAEPDLGTQLWMEKVRVTAKLQREGWFD